MLQETVLHLSGVYHQAGLIICNEEHRFAVNGNKELMGEKRRKYLICCKCK